MKILKKTGSILFCLLPVLLAFGIQIVVTFAGVFVKIMLLLAEEPLLFDGPGLSGLEHAIGQISSDSQFLTMVTASYALLAAIAMGIWYKARFVPKHMPRRKPSALINPCMFGGLLLLMVDRKSVV